MPVGSPNDSNNQHSKSLNQLIYTKNLHSIDFTNIKQGPGGNGGGITPGRNNIPPQGSQGHHGHNNDKYKILIDGHPAERNSQQKDILHYKPTQQGTLSVQQAVNIKYPHKSDSVSHGSHGNGHQNSYHGPSTP